MKLQCRKCKCSYFEKVLINEFHDYDGNIYSNLAEVNPASDVRGYRCVKCQTLNFPVLGYLTPDADKKLMAKLLKLADGGEVELDQQTMRSRRIAEGYIGASSDEDRTDPSKQGTFVQR